MCNDDNRPNDFRGVWGKFRDVYAAMEDQDPQEVEDQLDELHEELRQLAEAFDPGYRANTVNAEIDLEAVASMILKSIGKDPKLSEIAGYLYYRALSLLASPGDRRLVAEVFAMCLAWAAARGIPVTDLAMSAFLRNRVHEEQE